MRGSKQTKTKPEFADHQNPTAGERGVDQSKFIFKSINYATKKGRGFAPGPPHPPPKATCLLIIIETMLLTIEDPSCTIIVFPQWSIR